MKSVLLMGVIVYLVVLTGASVASVIASILSLVKFMLRILPRSRLVQVHSPSVVLVVLLGGHVRVVN
jgi:hypothetical protein